MELQLLENKQTLNSRPLNILIKLNPCLAENETLLLSYYKTVRATWSNSAIKSVQKATGLKLTNKLNRCQFAIEAAKQEWQFMQRQTQDINCYLEGEELPATSYQIIAELPSITSNQVEGFKIEEQKQLDTEEKTSQQWQIAQEQIHKLEWQLKKQEEQLEQKQQQLEQEKQQLEQSKNFSILLLTNRLLAPGRNHSFPPVKNEPTAPW